MSYKEIVTKAVLAKGKKKYKKTYQITVDEKPSTILGCWIINHNFSAKETNNKVLINGSFDANVWYSYENDTKTTVITKNITYTEEERLNNINSDIVNKDVIVRSLKQPTCTSAKEEGNTIILEIEKELGIEIIGDTKVKITSVEVEDTWDNLDNPDSSENQTETKAESDIPKIDNINENYISEEIIK